MTLVILNRPLTLFFHLNQVSSVITTQPTTPNPLLRTQSTKTYNFPANSTGTTPCWRKAEIF